MWKICSGEPRNLEKFAAENCGPYILFLSAKIDRLSKYTVFCTYYFNCSGFGDIWRICDIEPSLLWSTNIC